eukprot:339300-Rhodomonas_salina.4
MQQLALRHSLPGPCAGGGVLVSARRQALKVASLNIVKRSRPRTTRATSQPRLLSISEVPNSPGWTTLDVRTGDGGARAWEKRIWLETQLPGTRCQKC